MTKQEYFKMVREINNELRGEGVDWFKTYSEPRKKTSYRTKLYYVAYNPNGTVVDSVAAAKLITRVSQGQIESKRFIGKNYYGHSVVNLVMTPTNPLEQ